MQIVIDIPEKDYDDILNGETKASALNWSTFNAIREGTPLPKGHGRIVDIGPYEGKVIASRKYCGVNRLIEVSELDTIVEADKAESEVLDADTVAPTIIETDGGDADITDGKEIDEQTDDRGM